jgi:hypothetical protein
MDASNFIYDPNFFGISRSNDVIFVQLTQGSNHRRGQ